MWGQLKIVHTLHTLVNTQCGHGGVVKLILLDSLLQYRHLQIRRCVQRLSLCISHLQVIVTSRTQSTAKHVMI